MFINQIINLQIKLDWLDGTEDIQRYDFMAAVVRLETMRILLPEYSSQMWYLGERMYHWHMGPPRAYSFSYPFFSAMEL